MLRQAAGSNVQSITCRTIKTQLEIVLQLAGKQIKDCEAYQGSRVGRGDKVEDERDDRKNPEHLVSAHIVLFSVHNAAAGSACTRLDI